MKRWFIGVAILTLMVGDVAVAGTVYDAAADFSIASNPNGVWSYGYTTTLGGTPTLYTNSSTNVDGNSNFEGWVSNQGVGDTPLVVKNTATTEQRGGSVDLLAGELAFHPGPTGDQSVVRWTAPTAGSININATFEGRDIYGTTTDVHVLDNGTALFNGEVTGFGSSSDQTTSLSILVHAGDTIDFVVGDGSDGNFFYDTTGLAATIQYAAAPTPEPSGLVLSAIGGIGLIGRRLRRAKRAR